MKTRNRGKQSSDDKLFAQKWNPIFKDAADDLCFLLSRGYTDNSASQLVGNRYKLNKRQRIAIRRISCSDQQLKSRKQSSCKAEDVKNEPLEIDGFNLLILIESALSGAFIFKSRDGLYRDISSVHGSYKRVLKTEKALLLIGNLLNELEVKSVKWYFDQPVSNSGRLKTKLLELSKAKQFNWEVELAFDPDKILSTSSKIVVSSDGWILDRAKRWFNLGAYIIENQIAGSNIIDI